MGKKEVEKQEEGGLLLMPKCKTFSARWQPRFWWNRGGKKGNRPRGFPNINHVVEVTAARKQGTNHSLYRAFGRQEQLNKSQFSERSSDGVAG